MNASTTPPIPKMITIETMPSWMQEDLAKSGIPLDVAAGAGFCIAEPGTLHQLLGFGIASDVAAYSIPFRDPSTGQTMTTPDGRPFVRVKFEREIQLGDSKAKYASPKNGGNRAYIHKGVCAAAERGKAINITEGEKKALSAVCHGIPTIGLVGVWGFMDGNTKDLIADLHPYFQAGRTIRFVLDSDAATNPYIAGAIHRMSEIAWLRGATLQVVILPPHFVEVDGKVRTEKAGMDDIIVKDEPDSLRDILTKGQCVAGTIADIYVTGLVDYVKVCADNKADLALLAEEIVRKGFFNKITSATRRPLLTAFDTWLPGLNRAINDQILSRLDSEFANLTVPAHGGEGLANGKSVKAPGYDIPLRIDSLDGDLTYCFLSNSQTASRPFYRRHLELTERAPAAAANGEQGGRPHGPSATEIANAFLAQPSITSSTVCGLRYLRGQWYLYDGCRYCKLQEQDVKSIVMSFLRQHPIYSGVATTKTLNDVLNHLKATDAGGLPSDTQLPVWLAPAPSPAPGWSVIGKQCVNLETLVQGFNKNGSSDAEFICPATPRLFTQAYFDYELNPDATCPKFQTFLQDVMPDSHDSEVLQMLVGLCLVQDTRYNVFFLLFGPAGTGKSTFLYILLHVLGDANVCHLPFSKFTEKHSIGLLTEHLVNIIGEGDTELPNDVGLGKIEGILKDVSDGGLLPVEPKYCAPYKARAIARCIAATNGLPTFYDKSQALWDRMRIIEFKNVIRGTGKEVPNLRAEIVASELPGIFNWALLGLAKLRKLTRFPETAAGIRLKSDHRARCDHEREFLTDYFVEDSAAGPISSQEMFREYRGWMADKGYRPLGDGRFAESVLRVFQKAAKAKPRGIDGKQYHAWTGLRRFDGEKVKP